MELKILYNNKTFIEALKETLNVDDIPYETFWSWNTRGILKCRMKYPFGKKWYPVWDEKDIKTVTQTLAPYVIEREGRRQIYIGKQNGK